MADIMPPNKPTVPIGAGDDLDVAEGRCCPTCRNDLTRHNAAVWNAGYAVGTRHAKDDVDFYRAEAEAAYRARDAVVSTLAQSRNGGAA